MEKINNSHTLGKDENFKKKFFGGWRYENNLKIRSLVTKKIFALDEGRVCPLKYLKTKNESVNHVHSRYRL